MEPASAGRLHRAVHRRGAERNARRGVAAHPHPREQRRRLRILPGGGVVTEAEAQETILQQWATGWDALHGSETADPIPYCFDEEVFGAADCWVRVAINP